MNIEKIRQFMENHRDHVKEPFDLLTTPELAEQGVEHVDTQLKTVMMQLNALMNLDELIVLEPFPSEDYPYKAYTFLTDVKLYALVSEKDLHDYPFLQYLADQLEREEYPAFTDEEFLVDAVTNYAQ